MREFKKIQNKKFFQLQQLQTKKQDWQKMSSSERRLIHDKIIKLENELWQLKQYQIIKNKFNIR